MSPAADRSRQQSEPDQPAWAEAHAAANDAGHDGYVDSQSGLFVMTAGFHERRGNCCASQCRHCPY